MVDDNLHRDIDTHARVTECNAESIAFVPPADSIEDVHRSAMNHRRDQIQDVPFCVDDQFYLCMEGTSQSPKENNFFVKNIFFF